MKTSSRLPWDAPANALAQALEQRRARGGEILDLTESNPTRAGIACNEDVILPALSDVRAARYDPSPKGLDEARQVVAAYERVPPDRILLTASTSEAYAFLFKLLADAGDEILVPRPSYPLFDFLASLECVTVRHFPLRYQEGWWMDRQALEAMINQRTRAIVVVSPNNPTGSYLKQSEWEWLRRCGQPVIVDEVFRDYAFEPDVHRVIRPEPAFLLNGFSKLLGLPQMKLAWIVVPDAESMRRLELIADTYLSVGAPVQVAAARWMSLRPTFQSSMMVRLRANLAALGTRFQPLRVEGGWYAILRLPRTRSEEAWVLTLLREEGVLVQPGYFYDFEDEAYAVVSLLTRPDVFVEGIDRIWRRVY
jgi:hypothetical protein